MIKYEWESFTRNKSRKNVNCERSISCMKQYAVSKHLLITLANDETLITTHEYRKTSNFREYVDLMRCLRWGKSTHSNTFPSAWEIFMPPLICFAFLFTTLLSIPTQFSALWIFIKSSTSCLPVLSPMSPPRPLFGPYWGSERVGVGGERCDALM